MKRWVCLIPVLCLLTGCGIEVPMDTGRDDSTKVLSESGDWFSEVFGQLEENVLKLKETSIQISKQDVLTEKKESDALETIWNDRSVKQEEVIIETGEAEKTDYYRTREEVGLSSAMDPGLLIAQSGHYSFGCLSSEEQLLYVDIVQILSHMAEDIEIRIPKECEDDLSVIGKVFQCVMNDHPEFFYADGYTYTRYTEGNADGRLIRVTFSGRYTMSPAKKAKCEEKIKEYTDVVLSGIPKEASEYEKVKYIYEYIILHTDYKLHAKEDQNICSVFLYGESVCQGYAKAMQYLLEQAGIQATLVSGVVEKGEGHAWNLVRIDGDYYYVDPTWGDASYEMSGEVQETEGIRIPSINYDYLCVTQEQLTKTHTIDNVVALPQCTATRANYYRMEDAYFTGYDREQIKRLFEKAYARGDEIVTLKCSDCTAYEEVKRMLLDAQEVFEYLDSPEGKVAYTNSNEQLSISFWL
ncbi:MAG: hypothetical protein GX234_10715 [Clostridiales bacterium]|nr:hypothetical protein [Clostridiales bacterium]